LDPSETARRTNSLRVDERTPEFSVRRFFKMAKYFERMVDDLES